MYEVQEITSIQEVRQLFPNGFADELNWLLCSTSGIHGSYLTLDELEYIIRGEDPNNPPLPNGKWYITILIIFPRRVTMLYGEIMIGLEDIQYLRKLVRSTLENIERSQERNV